MFHWFNAADAGLCRWEDGSEPAFLDQIAELRLEFHDVLTGRAVAGRVRIEARAARLIEHPDARLAIAEGDFPADQRARERERVHGGGDFPRGDELRLFLFFRLHFRGFHQLDSEVEDEKTGVHVSERVPEVLLQVALEIRHGGSLGGPLLESFFLFRSELAGAEHVAVLAGSHQLPSPKTSRVVLSAIGSCSHY